MGFEIFKIGGVKLKSIFQQKKFMGFSDYLKDVIEPDHYYFAQSIDYRSDPQGITLLPAPLLESGTVVSDLLKCADIVPSDLSVYAYGSNGNFYKRTSAGSWSALRTVSNSHGNGIAYFGGDDYVYYPTDKTLGRYGPISGTPQFSDDFLGSMGGVRLNTYSATFASASSQYATAADSASLSLTGNLTLECYINPTSLPTTGNQMILMSKWRAGNNTRSYKFDMAGIAATFGDGTDGNLTISGNTTEAPIDSACTGTGGTYTLSATNGSFTTQQEILIHQTQGTNAGTWMRTSIVGYTAGTITTADALNITYGTGAQVRVLKKYGNVTVNGGVTWTAKAWNGTVGGILAFLCNGTLTVTGSINATGCGFRGGAATNGTNSKQAGYQGEGTGGVGGVTYVANGNGGGGGNTTGGLDGVGGGGGGGNGSGGAAGNDGQANGGYSGGTSGNNALTTLTFGGGGGGGANGPRSVSCPAGGSGGGIVFCYASTVVTITGSIISGGNNGGTGSGEYFVASGAGAGGSVLIKGITVDVGSNKITCPGATGGASYFNPQGGNSGYGRVHVDYYTSITGSTTPTLDYAQDNNLSSNTTYQLRLSVSSNGTAYETMARTCSLTTATWKHVAVTWTAASHISEFFLNGNTLGTSVGAITAINNNASLFLLASQDTDLGSYYDGKMDEVRVWNLVRATADIYNYKDVQISASSNGLQAYYQLNNAWTDATANNNTLTAVNTPTFTTDTPFLSPSTRLDMDLSQTATGQTYTVPVAIAESAANMVSFVPTKDPLKSISVLVAAKGTGDWTLTLHDFSNIVIATVTITNANLIVGTTEFIFTTPFRFQIGSTYHFHLTSTVADGTVTTNTASNLSTVGYNTYFQILVTDTSFHPTVPFLNFVVIGNERYLATWNGVFFTPNLIAFPPQTKVRCFAFWKNYLAIGVWKEATSGTPNIYDWTSGRIYFWDGISLTFNFWIDVPEGQINSMWGNNNLLYIMAGYKGDLLIYEGGYTTTIGNASTAKVKRIPLQTPSDYLEVYPGAMNMWRSMINIGVAANSNSTTISKGVYSWGTLNKLYPDTLSLDYIPSTGSTGSTVKIGLVYPVGQTLLVGWQDGASYGCDQVNFNNVPARHGTIQTLLQDEGTIWHQSDIMKVRADYQPLRSGESINLNYSLNRGAEVPMPISDSTVGQTESMLQVSNGRHQEYQIGIDMYASGSTSPTLLGLSALLDNLTEEQTF